MEKTHQHQKIRTRHLPLPAVLSVSPLCKREPILFTSKALNYRVGPPRFTRAVKKWFSPSFESSDFTNSYHTPPPAPQTSESEPWWHCASLRQLTKRIQTQPPTKQCPQVNTRGNAPARPGPRPGAPKLSPFNLTPRRIRH